MRRTTPFLVGLALAATAILPGPASAGSYVVDWQGAGLHGRFNAVTEQFLGGVYLPTDTASGIRIEAPAGSTIAPGGFGVRSFGVPASTRILDVGATTTFCSSAANLAGGLEASSPTLTVISHNHGAPTCTTRSVAGSPVDRSMLTLVLAAGAGGTGVLPGPSWLELRSLTLRLADNAPPVATLANAGGAITGIPEVAVRWSAGDGLSGVGSVEPLVDGRAGSDVAALGGVDRTRMTGQRSGGVATLEGTARVSIPAEPGQHVLRVRVTDVAGNTAESGAIAVSYVAPPRVLTAPAIAGVARVGSTLTCDPGSWADPQPTLRITWRRDGVAIAGAEAASYSLAPADADHRVDCRVSAANAGTAAGGMPTVVSSAAVLVAPIPDPLPPAPPQPAAPSPVIGSPGPTPGSPSESAPVATGRLTAEAFRAGRMLPRAAATTVAAGSTVLVAGRSPVDGGVVQVRLVTAGVVVAVWQAPLEHGRFALRVRPARGGRLEVRQDGVDGGSPVGVAQLRLRPFVSARFTAVGAGFGTVVRLAVRGRVLPAAAGQRLQWQGRSARGPWISICRADDVIRVRADGRFAGRCRLGVRLWARNRYRLVLAAAPEHGLVGSASVPRTVRLRG